MGGVTWSDDEALAFRDDEEEGKPAMKIQMRRASEVKAVDSATLKSFSLGLAPGKARFPGEDAREGEGSNASSTNEQGGGGGGGGGGGEGAPSAAAAPDPLSVSTDHSVGGGHGAGGNGSGGEGGNSSSPEMPLPPSRYNSFPTATTTSPPSTAPDPFTSPSVIGGAGSFFIW